MRDRHVRPERAQRLLIRHDPPIRLLPQAVHDARDQELTWAQIGEFPGATATTAARRYQDKP